MHACILPILPTLVSSGHYWGMSDKPQHRPGEGILDRYCPGLSASEREAALERLRRLARLIIRISKRLETEAYFPSEDSLKPDPRGTIRSLPHDV